MKRLPDDDYELIDGAAWFEVKDFAIYIHSTNEGVGVEIVSRRDMQSDALCAPAATAFAYYESIEVSHE